VVGDEKLAEELTKLANKKLAGASLREKVMSLVRRRIRELEKIAFNEHK